MSASVGAGQAIGSVLLAALGCNVAWGIVDGVMFVVTTMVERTRRLNLVEGIRNASIIEASQIFAESLPEEIHSVISATEADLLLSRIRALPAATRPRILSFDDITAALLIVALVTASTVPPSIPFLLIENLPTAMRVSNAVSLIMLFSIGAKLGKYMGRSPWPTALAMTAIGACLVAVTIAFGIADQAATGRAQLVFKIALRHAQSLHADGRNKPCQHNAGKTDEYGKNACYPVFGGNIAKPIVSPVTKVKYNASSIRQFSILPATNPAPAIARSTPDKIGHNTLNCWAKAATNRSLIFLDRDRLRICRRLLPFLVTDRPSASLLRQLNLDLMTSKFRSRGSILLCCINT